MKMTACTCLHLVWIKEIVERQHNIFMDLALWFNDLTVHYLLESRARISGLFLDLLNKFRSDSKRQSI